MCFFYYIILTSDLKYYTGYRMSVFSLRFGGAKFGINCLNIEIKNLSGLLYVFIEYVTSDLI